MVPRWRSSAGRKRLAKPYAIPTVGWRGPETRLRRFRKEQQATNEPRTTIPYHDTAIHLSDQIRGIKNYPEISVGAAAGH